MDAIKKLFTNTSWQKIIKKNFGQIDYAKCGTYNDSIACEYKIDMINDHVASLNKSVFDLRKAAAMYFWYKAADSSDTSIIRFFPEYKHCIDSNHPNFNSNYGVYAKVGLKNCIESLIQDKDTRQACFMINNNDAMSKNSIDKLCTNAIMFFITKDNELKMVIQMRSSNLLTLLPYDMFIFSTWYVYVYNTLIRTYHNLKTTIAKIQVGSLHFYSKDLLSKLFTMNSVNNTDKLFTKYDLTNHNFILDLESKLLSFLK